MAGNELFPGSNSPIAPRGVVLHEDYFRAPFGEEPLAAFRTDVVAANTALDAPRQFDLNRTPDLTLAVQSCNESPSEVERFFEGARPQIRAYPGSVQVLLLSARNSRTTEAYARNECDAQVVPVEMGPGFRADMQNRALEVADHNSVVFGIGHTTLAYSRWLELAGFEISDPNVLAAYGTALPNDGASYGERRGALLLKADKLLAGGRKPAEADTPGLLASDCSVVKKDVITAVTDGKNYPVEYGRGGQDGRLGNLLMEWAAKEEGPGQVIFNPALSVHHTDGLNAKETLLRYAEWMKWGKPGDHKGMTHNFVPTRNRYGGF